MAGAKGEFEECPKCKKKNNPLVLLLTDGESQCYLCPLCAHQHNHDETKRLDEQIISSDRTQLADQQSLEHDLEQVQRTKVQEKARSAISIIMKLGVRKQDTNEIGKFQPTCSDIQVIEALASDICLLLRNSSLSQFHSILYPKKSTVSEERELDGSLFDLSDSKLTNKLEYRDQKKRANMFVKELIKCKSKTVYLLDGHGRMLLSIIHAIKEKGENLDNQQFVVVDWDEESHNFHQHFFPRSVRCECKNILEIDLQKTDMLYMNFCSIPPKTDDVFFNKEEVLKWLWQRMKTMESPIMISAMIRENIQDLTAEHGLRCHLTPAGFQKCLEDESLFRATVVSKRNLFMTWLVKPKSCLAKRQPANLKSVFEDLLIPWDCNSKFRIDALVYVESQGSDEKYRIVRRTPASAYLQRDGDKDGEEIMKRITSIKLVNDN